MDNIGECGALDGLVEWALLTFRDLAALLLSGAFLFYIGDALKGLADDCRDDAECDYRHPGAFGEGGRRKAGGD